MSVLGGQFALLTILLAGLGLTALLWRGSKPILALELFGLSWLLGAGVVSALLALGGIFLTGLPLFVGVLLAVLALGITGFRRCRTGKCRIVLDTLEALPSLRAPNTTNNQEPGTRNQESPQSSTTPSLPPPPRPWRRTLSLLAPLIPVLYMTWASLHQAMTWDGLLIWESKARHAFLAGGHLPAAYFTDATRLGFHPSYPLYLPFTELWMYLWMGDCDQTALKALFPFFYAAATALLWSTAFRLSGGHRGCAALAALLPLFVPMMTDHGFGLVHGYADFLIGTVYLAGVGALLAWRFRGVESGWSIAVACGALLPWIKQEGLFFFASLVLLGIVTLEHWRDGRGWRRVLGLAVPGLVVLISWQIALRILHVVPQEDFLPMTVENLVARLPRLWPIFYLMGAQLALLKSWSLLWFLTPVALILLACPRQHDGNLNRDRRRETLGLAVAVFAPLAMDIVPYLFTRLDFVIHVATSLERLVLQVSLVAVLILALVTARRAQKL